MFKACARSRFATHANLLRPRSIAAGLLTRLPKPQAPCPSQKRPYATERARSLSSTTEFDERSAEDSNARLAQHLNHVFDPLEFPPELASRILTHTSFRNWRLANNGRLSFIGRRVLNSFLLMFLQSSPTLNSEHDLELICERALDTHVLGEYVAPHWDLGRVMRWTPVQSTNHNSSAPSAVGLYKIQGTTVEAVMGGIYHHFGGAVAHRVFHTRLLPHLLAPGRPQGLHDSFHADATKRLQEMGGPNANLIADASPSASSEIR